MPTSWASCATTLGVLSARFKKIKRRVIDRCRSNALNPMCYIKDLNLHHRSSSYIISIPLMFRILSRKNVFLRKKSVRFIMRVDYIRLNAAKCFTLMKKSSFEVCVFIS